MHITIYKIMKKQSKAYERALIIAPEYDEALKNLAISYRDAGQYAGEKEGNIAKSIKISESIFKTHAGRLRKL